MNKLNTYWMIFLAALWLAATGCAAARAPAAAESPEPGAAQGPVAYDGDPSSEPPSEEAGMAGADDSMEAEAAPAAPSAAAGAGADVARAKSARREAAEPKTPERPGLGTAFGETLSSPTTTAPFVRDSNAPFAVATLWYNDRTGANAMARWADYRSNDRGAASVLGGRLSVMVRQPKGRMLPGFFAGGKHYVIGDAGNRYVVVIRNNTNHRFECVTTVDGLDVIDGRAGSYAKRGYLIQPHGTLEIEGFRRSAGAVAAFRFSSVRGSYAKRSGKGDRNVGVVGVAFFAEQGARPAWTQEEIRRRHSADPFPSRYAQPPSN